MTDSSNKKSKDKRYRIDSGLRDTNPAVTPLADEDAIDRLLLNTGFDADNEDEPESEWDAFIKKPFFPGTTEDFSGLEEDVRKFEPSLMDKGDDPEQTVSISVMSKEPDQTIAGAPLSEDISYAIEPDFEVKPELKPNDSDNEPDIAPIDFAIEERIGVEDLIEPIKIHHETELADPGVELSPEQLGDGGTGIANEAMLASFGRLKPGQELSNRQQEKWLGNVEAKVKKGSILAYVALGVAVTALIAAFVLAMTLYKATAEISRLSDLISLIEEETAGFNDKNSVIESGKSDLPFERLSQALDVDSAETGQDRQTSAKERPGLHVRADDVADSRQASVRTEPKSGWFVNLISFKQRSDADTQAAEFMRKGVRTEIVEVEVNNAVWYRLRVGGFINQEQAAAYAEKIKKPLRLNSIWVAGS